MLDRNKWDQYGFERTEADILGITIHETGNYDMNAEQLEQYLNDECKTSQGCHYIVDDVQAVQVMPDNWAVYHTGKGKDFGCRYTIAIEICSSLNDIKYLTAEENAVDLIETLKEKYGIKNEMIFFHNDFNQTTHCPNRIIDLYKTSRNFAYQRIEGE